MTSVNSTEPSNLWLTGKLGMDHANHEQKLLKKMIPRIYRCDASEITICSQDLFEDELFFFMNPDTLDSIGFFGSSVKRRDGTYTAVEDILERLPNASKIR